MAFAADLRREPCWSCASDLTPANWPSYSYRWSPEPLDRIQELEGDVQDLRHQLTEAQERLDFAERLLAKPKA